MWDRFKLLLYRLIRFKLQVGRSDIRLEIDFRQDIKQVVAISDSFIILFIFCY